MITKIQKWGNSLGLRIPKGIAEDAHVAEGARVDLKVENGRLVIAAVSRSCAVAGPDTRDSRGFRVLRPKVFTTKADPA